jgi:hypothetical protein
MTSSYFQNATMPQAGQGNTIPLRSKTLIVGAWYSTELSGYLLYFACDLAKLGLHIHFTQEIQTVVSLSILNGAIQWDVH